jgi:CubicO group peptidase (beta-lactamase class C family)
MMNILWQKNYEIDSILIVRNGCVVLDTYHFPKVPDFKHNIFSCTKSISSTLIGIAIDKGYIKSVDQPLLDFFPEKIPKNPDKRKRQITLKDVLQMATGLKCRDSYLYQWKGITEMRLSEDWVQYMIDLPLVEAPGTRFEYCNGASFLLTAIIEKTTGNTGLEFAQEHLFKPLGINDIYWPANIHGQTIGWGRIHMRPRDMAKFGYLFLNNGRWDDQQVVSAKWVADSTQKHISATLMPGYGYQWWVMSPGNYAALGYRGQLIFVLKERQMVVVFTSRLKEQDVLIPGGILRGYIIPAVKSNSPLPENTKASKRLRSLDRFWQTANYDDRDKRRKELATEDPSPKRKLYVNKQFGFSAEYDAELVVSPQTLEPPFVFRKTGLRGLPAFTVAVDDIPQGLKLNESEKHMLGFMKGMNQFSDLKVNHKEVIHLADGTTANYFEIGAKYQIYEMVIAGVIGYKNKKLIVVAAIGVLETPIEYLKGMVRSLNLEIAEP